jgi:N-acetylglucosamine-6-sulfatase
MAITLTSSKHDPYETTNLYPATSSSSSSPSDDSAAQLFYFTRTKLSSESEDLAFEFQFPATSGSSASQPPNVTTSSTGAVPITKLISRLDSLLLVLKTCKGRKCTHPWEVLHPKADVRNLHDALGPEFDEFYEVQQERVYFTKCENGYILESEGPQGVRRYEVEEVGVRGGVGWQDLV